ncbi:MAG TPA: sigma 54-interacting transcriptional regulator [Vicinamibacterales bacterium]|nr:sigma 54-interacting transcriptional regulator [Vicinamibacterales bacterium]
MRDNNVDRKDHTNEIRRLTTLLEISQALSGVLDLKGALHSVLGTLERRHEVVGSAIVLQDEETRAFQVEASGGGRGAPGRGRPGSAETMTARVVDTGRAVVVPQVSREPALAHMAGRGEQTFIAVPIVEGRRPAGALEIFLRFKKDRDYQRSLEFYRLVASMLSHAIKAARLVEAERHRLAEENEHLRDELRDRYAFRNIIGNSAPIQQVYEQVTQVARTNTTVLVRGESGTGKEMIAHAIHYNSPRAKKPFVKVSCAALPESLIESELFGYEKGAFTGAQNTKKGRFELADGGTLFLDEIGDLNPSTQVKLLRVLQEREIERLGGTATIKINVRLIAATHQPLETHIEDGRFRSDLYYRLAVFTIFAPPLRERKPDIMLLADHFLEKYSREHGKRIRRVSTPAIDMLTSYHWPGNVRELENTIERSVLVCDGGVIHGHHLPPALQTAEASGTTPRMSLAESVEAFERDLLQDALKSTRGNRARAARLLGTTERIFNYKVRKYAVDTRRFRN